MSLPGIIFEFIIIVVVVVAAALLMYWRKSAMEVRDDAADSGAPEDESSTPENAIPAEGDIVYVEATPPPTGILLAGYPGIDADVAVAVSIVDGVVVLESTETGGEVGRIPVKDITKATLVDKSHEVRRISPTGVLIFGVLAAIFPDKVLVKSYFTRIVWAFEGTHYETIITFDNAEWADGFIGALNNERAGLQG